MPLVRYRVKIIIMERKNIREPQYTDEEIEDIITKHIKLNCPNYNDLTEEQFIVPYET